MGAAVASAALRQICRCCCSRDGQLAARRQLVNSKGRKLAPSRLESRISPADGPECGAGFRPVEISACNGVGFVHSVQ